MQLSDSSENTLVDIMNSVHDSDMGSSALAWEEAYSSFHAAWLCTKWRQPAIPEKMAVGLKLTGLA